MFQPSSDSSKHFCLIRWRIKTANARAREEGFTEDEKFEALDWDHCACGEALQGFPALVKYGFRFPPSEPRRVACPVDDELYHLGKHFADAVWFNEFTKCEKLLTKMERRLVYLDKLAERQAIEV